LHDDAPVMSPSSLRELTDFLSATGIDTSSWGSGATKTVIDLWREIAEGATTIQFGRVQRTVSVVRVMIRRGECVLFETHQMLANGFVRRRYRLPAEKVRHQESYVDAAKRCLREELSLESDVHARSHTQREETRESPSYPGLSTRYVVNTVDAEASSLPDCDFSTDEAELGAHDVVRHYWTWMSDPHLLRSL
jgi:ADP-ribose pyrophosphatase YjhB (NUDIX family)